MSKTACCTRCTGGGQIASAEECPECCGQPAMNFDGHTIICEHCHGTGRKNTACPDCGGTGH